MESIRGMIIDIPVVQTDTEASVVKAEADRDPPHPTKSQIDFMLLSSFLIDNVVIRIASVSLSKIEVTVLNMFADSAISRLSAKLH